MGPRRPNSSANAAGNGGPESFATTYRFQLLTVSNFSNGTPGPVSYTHLDVYKRQERGSIVYQGDSTALKADRALLETYVGVTDASSVSRKAQRDARRTTSAPGAGAG